MASLNRQIITIALAELYVLKKFNKAGAPPPLWAAGLMQE